MLWLLRRRNQSDRSRVGRQNLAWGWRFEGKEETTDVGLGWEAELLRRSIDWAQLSDSGGS